MYKTRTICLTILIVAMLFQCARAGGEGSHGLMPRGYVALEPGISNEDGEKAESDLVELMATMTSYERQHAIAASDSPFLTAGDLDGIIGFTERYTSCDAAVTGRLFLATLILEEGRFSDADEAIAVLEDIEEARPATWQANVASLLRLADRVREARDAAEYGVEEMPALEAFCEEAKRSIPTLRALDRQTKRSIELYRNWLARPDEGSLFVASTFKMARMYEAMGDLAEARQSYLQIIHYAWGKRSVNQARADLNSLEKRTVSVDQEDRVLQTDRQDPRSTRQRRSEVLRQELKSASANVPDPEGRTLEGPSGETAPGGANQLADGGPNESSPRGHGRDLLSLVLLFLLLGGTVARVLQRSRKGFLGRRKR